MISTFPFICSNIWTVHVYGVYISQLIRYSRACGSYHDFLDRGLLLARKLLNLINSKVLRSPPWLGWPLRNICVTNDHGYVPLVISTSRSLLHSWLTTGFVTRVTRRKSLVEQELPTLPEHLSSPPVFSGVRVARIEVFCVVFCRSLFVLLSVFFWRLYCLSFDLRILIISRCIIKLLLVTWGQRNLNSCPFFRQHGWTKIRLNCLMPLSTIFHLYSVGHFVKKKLEEIKGVTKRRK